MTRGDLPRLQSVFERQPPCSRRQLAAPIGFTGEFALATKHVSNDRTTTLKINGSNDRWIIDAGTRIDVLTDGIVEATTASNNTIEIDGFVRGGNIGLLVQGTNTRIIVDTSGKILGGDALAGADDATLINRGLISGFGSGSDAGIDLELRARIDNFGTITADYAVEIDTGLIHNHKGATIAGDDDAISSGAGIGQIKLINDGTITSPIDAYDGDNGRDWIINHGVMKGTVRLGEGNDIFDNRDGAYDGTLIGGDGDDVLLTSDKLEFMAESNDGGIDTVKSTVGFDLWLNFEKLVLLGNKNITGRGNDLGNTMTGNSGDNKLFGLTGSDYLDGKSGDDRLSGGATLGESDVFLFSTGGDHDIIIDFEDNVDSVNLGGLDAVKTFNDLINNHTRDNAAGNLVIFAGDDRLTIEGMTRAQLDSGDVFFD